MGKEWDRALPPKEAFQQMFRILKPGAIAFVMSSPRQDVLWRMLKMLEECDFELKQSFISWIYKSGFPKAFDISKCIEKRGIISEAEKWQGWKTISGLKPALECVLMVNKPLKEKSAVDNVLKYRSGAINIDACRIPLVGEVIETHCEEGTRLDTQGMGWGFKRVNRDPNLGRFPANLLVSDRALSSFKYFDLDAWAKHHGFLDVPKPSKAERDRGLESIEPKVKDCEGKFSPSKKAQDKELVDRLHEQKLRRNYHPTVKPIRLMAYLIELGCPKDGIVLDPFVGSGTTCMAAQMLGRKWIGVEIEPQYVKIAEERLKPYLAQTSIHGEL